MKTGIVLVVVLFAFGLSFAQQTEVSELQPTTSTGGVGLKPAHSAFSLLSSDRITWSHSYSVSYFSGGGVSGSAGLLNSTMYYEFSPKLSLALNLGILHDPSALWGNGENQASLLPGFRLDYHPSDKVSMSVSFQRYNGFYSPYTGFGQVRPYSPYYR